MSSFCTVGTWKRLAYPFRPQKKVDKWKARHHQQAAGASRSRLQDKHIKNFISESCSKVLVADLYSLRVLATLCSGTSTPTLVTLERRKNIEWTPRTLPRRQRPQWHQPSCYQSPNLLLNLNLRLLYLQCPYFGLRTGPLEAWDPPSASCTCGRLKARQRRRIQGKEEPKMTVKAHMYEQMMYSAVKGSLRAL